VIDPTTMPKEYRDRKYSKFSRRDPSKPGSADAQKVIDYRLNRMVRSTRFFIRDVSVHDVSGLPQSRGGSWGVTRRLEYLEEDQGPVQVSLAISLIESLLRTDLTSAERAVDTFRLAATLLHETAVRRALGTETRLR